MLDPDVPTSATLIAQFRAGDRAAFLQVYDLFADKIGGVARRFFNTAFDQEEAIQEIWLMVHRQCAHFDANKGDLGGWLWVVATNRCKELWRSRSRRPDLLPADSGASAAPSTSDAPDVQMQSQRLMAAMARFSERLDATEAQVFRLSCLEERTHDEVATLTGLTARQCKYLRMKLLARAAADADLSLAMQEVTQP